MFVAGKESHLPGAYIYHPTCAIHLSERREIEKYEACPGLTPRQSGTSRPGCIPLSPVYYQTDGLERLRPLEPWAPALTPVLSRMGAVRAMTFSNFVD